MYVVEVVKVVEARVIAQTMLSSSASLSCDWYRLLPRGAFAAGAASNRLGHQIHLALVLHGFWLVKALLYQHSRGLCSRYGDRQGSIQVDRRHGVWSKLWFKLVEFPMFTIISTLAKYIEYNATNWSGTGSIIIVD